MKRSIACALIAGYALAATGFLSVPGTTKEKGEWVVLFGGTSLDAWHSYHQEKVVGWFVEDGNLTTDGSGGDLVSNREFGDFDLEFEFKIPAKSNSGVLYKVLEKPEIKRTVFSGPEYQIIDDKGYEWRDKDGTLLHLKPSQLTGANYDMHAPSDLTAVKAPGTWNKGRIVVKGNRIRHYLNGKMVVDYQYGDNQWKELVAKSKYNEWPYAQPHAKGKIGLQSHNAKEKIWYRNIRIKEL